MHSLLNIWVVLAMRTSCEHLFTGLVSTFFATESKSGNKIILYFHLCQGLRVPGFSPPTSAWTSSCAHDAPVSVPGVFLPWAFTLETSILSGTHPRPRGTGICYRRDITELYLTSTILRKLSAARPVGTGESQRGLCAGHPPNARKGEVGLRQPQSCALAVPGIPSARPWDQLCQCPASCRSGLERPRMLPHFPPEASGHRAPSSSRCRPRAGVKGSAL